jgi:YVTN family beta-propeller protein
MHAQELQSQAALVAAGQHSAAGFASRDGLRHRCPDPDHAQRATLLGRVWLTALALLVPGDVRAQQGPFVYVPNLNSGDLTVIDTPTNTAAPTAIPIGLGPLAAAVRGDQSLVYVTIIGDNTVSVMDTSTNTVVASIPVGNSPWE